METIEYMCVPSFTSMCAILRSEEVILPEAIFCWWLSWKQLNTRAYQHVCYTEQVTGVKR